MTDILFERFGISEAEGQAIMDELIKEIPPYSGPKPKPRPPHCVYFIQAGENGPVKIGHATDVRKRLRNMQSGNPSELRLLLAYEGDGEEEFKLHCKFKKDRIRGEWFTLSPEMSEFIADREGLTHLFV